MDRYKRSDMDPSFTADQRVFLHEHNIACSASLGQGAQCIQWTKSYVRLLIEVQDTVRLRDLCWWLQPHALHIAGPNQRPMLACLTVEQRKVCRHPSSHSKGGPHAQDPRLHCFVYGAFGGVVQGHVATKRFFGTLLCVCVCSACCGVQCLLLL